MATYVWRHYFASWYAENLLGDIVVYFVPARSPECIPVCDQQAVE